MTPWNPVKGSACSSIGARSGSVAGSRATSPAGRRRASSERAVPVALPLKRRPAVLQQRRRASAAGTPDPLRDRGRHSKRRSGSRTSTSTSPPAWAAARAPRAGACRFSPRAPRPTNRRSWKRRRRATTSSSSPPRSCCPRTPTPRSTSTTRASARAESPCLTPPTPAPAGCSSEARCLPASPPLQAPVGPSGTASFSGPGNPAGQPPAKQEVKGTKTSSKPLTNAQKLAKALKACRKDRSAKKQKACEAHARKLYGPAQKLANALKACKKQHAGKKRKSCEAHARKLYGPKAKAKKTSTARTGRRTGR